LGITGKDFTLIAASKAAMRGATVLKASDDKTRALNKHTLMAFSGEAGDTSAFFPSHSNSFRAAADPST
jgi:20S proteasome subunit beta 4